VRDPAAAGPTGPIAGLRVVELGGSRAVRAAGAILADYGADVVVVEPPEGHPGRGRCRPPVDGPAGDDPTGGADGPTVDELWWRSAARNARSVVLDLDREADRAEGLALLSAADVVLDDGAPGPRAAWGDRWERAREANPGLVAVRITPYGETGPLADRPGDGVTAEAFAGLAHITGDPDGPPLHSDFPVGTSVTGLFGALSALAAVLQQRRRAGAEGAHVDLAAVEAVLRILEFLPVYHDRLGWVSERSGSTSSYQVPVNRWQTADGTWMSFTGNTEDTVRRFLTAMGRADLTADERYATNAARVANRVELEALIHDWFAARPRAEVDAAMATEGVPIAAILSMADVADEPQYRARRSLVPVDDHELGPVHVPSFAGRFSRTAPSVRHLGPALGADAEAVRAAWLDPAPAPSPDGGRVAATAPPRWAGDASPAGPAGPAEPATGPLAGLRVLDLGNVIAGPLTATLLGDLGADVVKVERPVTGDLFRRQAPLEDGQGVWWRVQGRGKRSVALDLKDAEDRALLLELVAEADVVVENFVPGVAEGLGIAHDDLLAANPRVVVVSISGYGQEGPMARRRAFGRNAEAFSGMAYLTGYPGDVPQHTGFPVADSYTALFGCVCALAALYERDVAGSGRGQWVDLALFETVFRFMEPQVLLHEVRGEVWARGDAAGRASTWRAVLPTADGRWVTLSSGGRADVVDAVAELVGCSPADVLAGAPALAAWSRDRSASEVVGAAADAGIPAAPVSTIADLVTDDQVASRGLLVRLAGTDGSPTLMPAVVPPFDDRRPVVRRPAPDLDADRGEVLAEWLGRPPSEPAPPGEATPPSELAPTARGEAS
jgi:formyl-CoA transferase